MPPTSPTGRMLVARGLYRRWLAKYFSTITLAGLAPDDEPILLRRIYVPLILAGEKISDYAPENQIHKKGHLLADWLDSLGRRKNVCLISGEAGSGKTTLVSAVVDSLSGEVSDDLNRRFEGYVPFPIRLREAPLDRIRSLAELVSWWLDQAKQEVPELDLKSVSSFLDMGRGILLLDGLDEVGTLTRRMRVMGWLRRHPWTRPSSLWSGKELFISPGDSPNFRSAPLSIYRGTPLNLVIVTARPSGFEGLKAEDLPAATSLFVAPFSHEQIRTYLTRWFELRPLRSDQRQSTVENLVTRLTSSEQAGRLLPLARRPAYLASLAFVHGTRGELPYTRAALYEQLVEAYIEMLDRQKGILERDEQRGELPVWDRQEKIEVLSAVAFQAHVGATTKQKSQPSSGSREEDRRLLWSYTELEDAVRVAVANGAQRFRAIRLEHVSQLTGYFIARTGLLVETREGQFQFGHLSFQEYLTALFLLNRASAGSDKARELERILFPRLGDPGWLEVGVLVLAIDANRSGGQGHEPILARLDLNDPHQLAYLAQLLSGEEIRFTAGERQAWLLVWLAFWAIRRGSGLDSPLRFPANRETLANAWKSVGFALRDGRSGLVALVGQVDQALDAIARPALPAQRSLDALIAASSSEDSVPDTPAALTAWSRFPHNEQPDLPTARLLAAPLLGGFLSHEEAEAILEILPSQVDLFVQSEPGRVQPTWIQYSLDSWSFRSGRLLPNLAEQTPLIWWLQDDYFALRVSANDQEPTRPFLRWRCTLWNQLLRIEQLWKISQLVGNKEISSDLIGERERERDLAQARDLSLALDLLRVLDRARDLSRARAPDLSQVRAVDLSRTRALERVRGRAKNWDRDLDRARDRARTRDRALVRAQARALALARDLALDLNLARDLALDLDLGRDRGQGGVRALNHLALVLERRRESLDKNQTTRNQATALFQAAMQGFFLSWLLSESLPVRRSELASTLEDFRTPEKVAYSFRGTPFSTQALQEWETVLASPFSPIPLLEDALSREWEELPTDPEGIAQLFEKALSELEKRH